jgi:redox-sensitive bicupin YhaK (pirin superfamily)
MLPEMSIYRSFRERLSCQHILAMRGGDPRPPHLQRTIIMGHRSIAFTRPVPVGLNRATIVTRDVTSDLMGDAANPFIVVSLFDMTGPTFPPHPHAGFTVATYLLPEGGSAFLNQDSTGFSNRIAPGGLHATVAGTGVLHEETNETNGASALGFQIWINMTAADRRQSPRPETLEAADVPVLRGDGRTIRVLAGASNGLASSLSLPTDVRIVDVALAAGAAFRQELKPGEQAFLFMVEGAVTIDGQGAGALHAVSLTAEGDALDVVAGADGARFVLFSGMPIREPLVQGGPFVGSSEEEIQAYFAAFRAGSMGALAPFAARKAG